ncbi:MAG: hypothetical protein M3Q30_27000, partial [Actinomycetota bacterium]|nr:hypothetical protein [Actinomycetota bacterium]
MRTPRRLVARAWTRFSFATAVATIAVLAPGVALAAWSGGGSGTGFVRATSMPTGAAPTLSVAGSNVTVTWTASPIGGTSVTAYTVRRYDANTLAAQTIGSSCSGTIAALTCTEAAVPAGAWKYTVTPRQGLWVGTEGPKSATATVIVPDTTPPTASAAVINKSTGDTPGYVKQGGQYYVYANVTDPGSNASGVSTVTANVTTVTTGAVASAMTPGTYTVGAVSYNYRSAPLTADGVLVAGSKVFAITATDVAMNATVQTGFSVTVDNTAPSAADIQTTNVAGGTNGLAESGDTMIFTFSEPLDPNSIVAGWNGSATTVAFRLNNGNPANDTVTVFDSANTLQLPLGSVDLGRKDLTGTNVTFASSTMVMSGSTITITLGAPVGGTATMEGTTAGMTWTPSATASDRAGNACL